MFHTEVVLAGRFQLEDRIAVGGMGEVWRAVDLIVGLPVAVKLLSAEYARAPEALARFRAEARHASSVSHPGIAQVYYYHDGNPPVPPCLVMELVEGPSLARVLAAGPLAPARTMDVIGQAAAALDAAHEAGLLHRDIKPPNLLLDQGGRVKVIDFGIAHAVGSAPLTRTGTLVGTADYLAPERAAGAAASPASDLYSLGVVAYECLTGSPPFSGSPLEIAAAHRNRPLPPLPRDVPAGVAALVTKLTAKDPRARPSSADQVSWWAFQLRDSMLEGQGIQPRSWPAGPVHPEDAWPGYQPGTSLADQADNGYPAAPGPLGPPTLAGNEYPIPPGPLRPPSLAGAGAGSLVGVGPVLPVGRRLSGPRPAPRPRPYQRGGRYGGYRARPRWKMVLAVAAAVAVGLIAALAMSVFRSAPPQKSATPAGSTPHAAARSVQVHAGALVGRTAGSVVRQLRRLGLRPRLERTVTSQQAAGRVVSVRPGGLVPIGSTVTVTAAVNPAPSPPGSGGGRGGGGGD
jgi:eukaryotic-like serine/threonine-protein kinase